MSEIQEVKTALPAIDGLKCARFEDLKADSLDDLRARLSPEARLQEIVRQDPKRMRKKAI